jgi:O-antigen ligase
VTSPTVTWRSNPREAVASVADRFAAFTFAILIVMSPMAARFDLVERPIADVAPVNSDFLLPFTYVGMLGILGLWAVSVACRPRRLDPGPAFVWVPIVGLLVVAAAGLPGSVDPALVGFNVLRLLVMVGIGAFVINEVHRLDRLAVPLMLMIGLEAFVGIGQAVLQRSIGLTWLSEIRDGVDFIGASIISTADGSRWLRAYGLTAHANILGGVMAIGLLLLAAVQGETVRVRFVRLAVLALGVVVLFLTFSRSAWVGFAVGLVVAIVMLVVQGDRVGVRRWAAAALTAAAVGLVLAVPFAAQLAARSTLAGPIRTEVRSIDERIALARVTLEVIADHPVLGTGLGTLPLVLPVSDPDFEFAYQPAHVVALDAAAETGLVGLAFYLTLAVAPWIALVRVRTRWTRPLAWTSAALAAVTVIGLFDFYTWTASAGRTWAWLVLGLWVVAYRQATRSER